MPPIPVTIATDTEAFLRDVFAYRADGAAKANGMDEQYSYYSFDIVQAGKQPFTSELRVKNTSRFLHKNPDDVVQLWEGMKPACSEQLRALVGEAD